jgi:uncharacterized protein (TIGR02646 family)
MAAGGWFPGASGLYRSAPILRMLKGIYNSKCAYCEQEPKGSPAQVEHFRPKDGVFGIVHTGYYWLAYEWSNLLLACGNCNSTKNNQFPIRNIPGRVLGPTLLAGVLDDRANFILNSPLKNEGFELINPEIDDPAKHIKFLPSGKIVDSNSPRGTLSIKVYGLNRDELWINGRKKIVDDLLYKFGRRIDRYVSGERAAIVVIDDLKDIIEEDIWRPISRNLSYSAFYKEMLLQYDQFLVAAIGNKRGATVLRIAFIKFIQSI